MAYTITGHNWPQGVILDGGQSLNRARNRARAWAKKEQQEMTIWNRHGSIVECITPDAPKQINRSAAPVTK